MDKNKVIEFIESSFLTELLSDKNVTDITYNGQDLYYVSNTKGRMKSSMIINPIKIKDFLRQISNLCEAQFSFSEPYLDLSIGKYRINAVHNAIAKIADEGVVTFAIRIASDDIKISDRSDFLSKEAVILLKEILRNRLSIVIGGVTSSGKTEFQKYLLLNLKKNERVIVIDNVLELDRVRNPNIDLTCWRCDEKIEKSRPSNLIKNALRNNPDWIILAESRGEEMADVLNSAMTGMPVITTLHSQDVYSMPFRMGRMMMQSQQKLDYQESLTDIFYHFHFYIYLNKDEENGYIKRYISQIMFSNNNGKQTVIYERKANKIVIAKLPKEAVSLFKLNQASSDFLNAFVGGKSNA